MALKVKLQSLQNHHTLVLDDRLLELLDWDKDQEIYLEIHGKELTLSPEKTQVLPDKVSNKLTEELPPPLPSLPPGPVGKLEEELEHYWNLARDRQDREKFMNTVRPYLRVKLGYDYSEVICEQKAKILCRKYYRAQEKGEEFTTPYWAAIESSKDS
jgi:hypothetical protein